MFVATCAAGALGLLGYLVRSVAPEWPWWPWFFAVGGLVFGIGAVAMVKRHPVVRVGIVGALLAGLALWLSSGVVPASTPGRGWWPLLIVVGSVLLAGAVGFGLHRQSGTAGTVGFWSWRSRRNKGVASAWQIWRVASLHACRKKLPHMRPAYRSVPWWRRWRVPAREYATALARVGLFRVWSPIENVTLRVGGPRTGKTGELGGRILDAPGAVIATSTRTDLIDLTQACRAQVGPTVVFNPAGVGNLESTITFDPLSGCTDAVVALDRAKDLLSGSAAPGEGGDRKFWEDQAQRALGALMHAAALGELGMRDVQHWAANPNDAQDGVLALLRRSNEPAVETDAMQFFGMNDRTQSSVSSTIMPALAWLSVPSAAAAAAPGGAFDVEQLVFQRGTVYMLGHHDNKTAPLVTALTGHIAREARRLAALRPGGRLDPPLTLALDEAALICPIPLDKWTADMGGRGVTIHIAAQSEAQLKQVWGKEGAASILTNTATMLIFGGAKDDEDLKSYSALTGHRDEYVPTYDEHHDVQARTMRRVEVLTPAQIAQLKERRVVIINRGMPAAVGRVQMAWKRHDVKAAKRAERYADTVERWTERRERFAESFGETVDEAAAWLEQREARRAQRKREQQAAAVQAELRRGGEWQ